MCRGYPPVVGRCPALLLRGRQGDRRSPTTVAISPLPFPLLRQRAAEAASGPLPPVAYSLP
jgi:hypothetical protein